MNLQEFVRAIEEGRPRKDDNLKHDPEAVEIVKQGKHVEIDKDGDLNAVKTVRVDNKPLQNVKLSEDEKNKNMKRLLMKFRAGEDFYIQGKAGWGKTSIVKDLAKRFGYIVLPEIYLATAEAVDLGGRPYNDKDEKGHVKQGVTLPPWAEEIWQNPDKKYLVFFDEMNQAQPDVMNTLMPIILEHTVAGEKMTNFFVGCAGNLDDENIALSSLDDNKPLKSRLMPIIKWETNTPETWKQSFSHLHKKFDDSLGKDVVEIFEKDPDIWDNPRNIDRYVFDFLLTLKKQGKDFYEDLEPEDYLDRLETMIEDIGVELSRSQETELKNMAQKLYNAMNDVDTEPKDTGRRKGMDMVSEQSRNAIKAGMRQGYISQEEDGKNVKYGISRENIVEAIAQGGEVNAEMAERLISKFEADGIKFRFEKDSEWRKAGYKDPFED